MALIKSNQTPIKIMILTILTVLLLGSVSQTHARKPHVITFRSPNLYPEGLTYDPSAQHFLVGSVRDRKIESVSDAGVVETLISDLDLPENATVLGLAVDTVNKRLLAAITAVDPLPHFTALASYDLQKRLTRTSWHYLEATHWERHIRRDQDLKVYLGQMIL